jgi:hypothetical protein
MADWLQAVRQTAEKIELDLPSGRAAAESSSTAVDAVAGGKGADAAGKGKKKQKNVEEGVSGNAAGEMVLAKKQKLRTECPLELWPTPTTTGSCLSSALLGCGLCCSGTGRSGSSLELLFEHQKGHIRNEADDGRD